MSAGTIEEPKTTRPRGPDGRLLPKAKALNEEPPCPISVEGLQAYVDWIAKDLELPMVKAGVHPLESYIDEDEPDPKKRQKNRPRKAVKLDENGNVVYGSGPVVPDGVASDLWEKVKPHLAQAVYKTVYAMSESTLIPERNGEIDDRSKLVKEILGRFVIADAQ